MAGDQARITVCNWGPPIPADARERLFERFFRAEESRARTTSAESGAGLGLAIARSIVQAHGGTLELVRSDTVETVFAAELPCRARS